LAPPFTGHFRVILDTPRGLQSLHPGTRSKDLAPITNGPPKASTSTSASLELRNSIYQTTAKASKKVSPVEASTLANSANGVHAAGGYSCDTCGSDCTAIRYHSLKVKDFELCQPCYLDGRFPSTMFSGDFVKLTSPANGVGHGHDDDWSDQELLLLLEGVEMYDDDWALIEEHVGTRSAQQCIRKFLELPIEDPYVATEGSMGALRYARIPFEQADNPVMSVVAFLAGVIGPGVAAEAAKTALHELTNDSTSPVGQNEKAEGTKDDAMAEEENTNDTKASDEKPTADKLNVTVPQSKAVRAAKLALQSSAKAAQTLADVEDKRIRASLASLIKLTLTKVELKMSQFEELEDILEDERRGLEAARMALLEERLQVKKTLDDVKAQIEKHGATGALNSINAASLAIASQGPMATEVSADTSMNAENGPVANGNFATLG
jgi:SWI/SNF related-matrix-associated actin-dependent regulator of chromatin subfamily C